MNILLTSVGRRSYMIDYFKRALKGIGNVHASNSIKTHALKFADKSIITPMIYDKSYKDFLLNYAIKNNIKAIIPLLDIDIPVLAKNKKIFSDNNIILIVSDLNIANICNDKWLTYTFLKDNKFNVPLTFINEKDALYALKNKIINFPLIIKPRWGYASIGIFEVDNYEELKVLYDKSKKIILNSFIKFESHADINNSILIQEKLTGNEFGLDVFNNLNGEFLSCIPKRKILMRAGETESAEIISNNSLFNLGKNLSEKLGHIGNLDVDTFYANNKHYVLELNCRFGGQYPFSHIAGVNFPKAIVKMLMGEKIEKKLLAVKTGTIGIKILTPIKLIK